jgi:septum site-determining protein MinD
MQRVVGILSGKGGVGKTVTAINLSAALHEFGHDTTIVDADISSANLTVHLGLPDAKESLQDALEGRVDIYKTVRVIPRGLKIIPASLSLDKSIIDMSTFKDIIRGGDLEGMTIIDAPPGYSKDIYHIMEACDELIVVTNPDVPSITDAIKVIEIAKRMGQENIGIVINRVEKIPSEVLVSEIESLCEVPLMGIIPEDREVKRSIFNKTPLVFHSPHSKAAIHYRHLAAKMVNEEYSPPSFIRIRRIFG